VTLEVFPGALAAAKAAATLIAAESRASIASRGRFSIAVSGGRTPWQMLEALADLDVPWAGVHVCQVDERVAPAGHPDRNATQLRRSLARAPLADGQVHLMPVDTDDLEAAAARYAATLESIAGRPPVLDLVHLGLGADGHTASLVPGDAALDIADRDVAVTGLYQGRRRMTLTFPAISRARRILWLVTGGDKAQMLERLAAGDRSIPAGRVRPDHATVVADAPAAGPR
jgi:6-phosphogluconolactonase